MPIKQEHRSLAINTALGPDVLAVRSISVREEISRLFHIEAELSSENNEIDFDKVIGKEVTLRLNVANKEKRYFAGIVSRLVQVANQDGYAHYRATIVPWLWMLTRTSDCRIFMEKTVPEILEEVFNDHDRKDFQLKLSGTYAKKEYCVQYRETDFNFVSRLMEQEGIYYFFDHKDGKHTVVLADAISAHKPCQGYEEIVFHDLDKGAPDREVVSGWTMEKEAQPVAYTLNDFDFKKPKTSLKVASNVTRKYGMAQTEIYDYPGEYVEHGDGERLADVRLNELQSQYEVLHGQANARGIVTGSTFKLKHHPRGDQNREYLITGTTMEIDAGEFSSSGGGGGGEFFSCNFTSIEQAQQYRPARTTPKPIVQGPQTAIVVGPAGQEIYVDDHARIKVQFHWDRYGQKDENSSCWIRVTQPWAGKGYGCMNIPRIGQEVIVDFLEGDPDQPVINGRLYNADSMPNASNAGRDGKPGNAPPSGIPAAAMMTSFKSSSLGGSGGHNEITMNDEGGKEGLLFKAQKDEIHNVGNDREDTVTNNETRKVGVDRSREVGNNEKVKIGVNREKTVGTDEKETIGANKTIDVGSNHTENIGSNMSLTVGKNQSITVAMLKTESVGLASMENVGAAKALSIGAGYAVTVGGAMNTAVGLAQFEEVGMTKKVVVGDAIEITCGSSSFKMDKSGKVTIKGSEISIEASGNVTIKGAKIDLN